MDSGKHLYQRIIDDIQTKIHSGAYPADSRLPSENEMAKLYGTSVPTVRQALAQLVHADAIIRIKGKGSFVRSNDDIEDSIIPNGRNNSMPFLSFVTDETSCDNSITKIFNGAKSYLINKNYSISILFNKDSNEAGSQLLEQAALSGSKGVLFFSRNPDKNADKVLSLEKRDIPVIFIDRAPKHSPCSLVGSYNTEGAYRIAKVHLENGHRKIAFIGENFNLYTEVERISGYKYALKEFNVPINEDFIIENARNKPHILLSLVKNGVTAIQCVNDRLALWAIKLLQSEGFCVPANVSVSGFDGTESAFFSVPKLTTAIQPFEEIGRFAAQRLLKRINSDYGHSQIFLPVKIAVNESTALLKPKQ